MNPRYRRDGTAHGRSTGQPQPPGSKKASRSRDSRWAETRVAFVIARRNTIRSLGRSVLIALLVALPIAGLTAVAVTFASGEPTAEERVSTELAGNGARLHVVSSAGSEVSQEPLFSENWIITAGERAGPGVDLSTVLPKGTRILPLYSAGFVTTAADSGGVNLSVTEGLSWEESFSGMYDIVEGVAPKHDREILATHALLDRLNIRIGDTVSLRSPRAITATVVGIMDDHTRPDSSSWIFARPGALSGLTPGAAEDFELAGFDFYLPDVELSWDAVRELNAHGVTALSRPVLLDPPPNGENIIMRGDGGIMATIIIMGAIGAAFAAFEVILLAGAAFTVTARQHQRSLATIASVGAPRRTLFLVLAAQGVVLGAVGGIIGIAAGIGSAATFMALSSDGSRTQYYGFHIPWLVLGGFAAFAVAIGWLASLLPARNASRFDVVAALRGARKPPPPRRRTPVIGIALLIVGVVLAIAGGLLLPILLDAGHGLANGHPLLWIPICMLIVGPIMAQVGLMLCGALMLRTIARLAQRAGLGARLATRDAARNPNRAVPALAAIMSTVFVAVFAMCMFAAADEYQRLNHRHTLTLGQASVHLYGYTWDDDVHIWQHENPRALEDAMRATIDVEDVRTIASVPHPFSPGTGLTVTDERREAGSTWQVPRIPANNICPYLPDSPEYTSAFEDPNSAESRQARDDWRCADGIVWLGGPLVSQIFVGDAEDLAFLLERDVSTQARQTLEAGGAVSLYPHYVADGKFTIDWLTNDQAMLRDSGQETGAPVRSETIPAVVESPDYPINFMVFITPKTADNLGIDYLDSQLVATTGAMPPTSAMDDLHAAFRTTLSKNIGEIWFELETGPRENAAPWVWGLLALSGLIALASSAVAIGLARFDGRQDDATLAAVGATPLLRRSVAFWQAMIVAGAGSFLGAAMGLLPALALGANPGTPFAAPWLPIGIAIVALPLLIAAGSWIFTRRPKVQTRRMSIA